MMQAQYPTQPGMGPGHPGMAHGHPVQMQHNGHMGQPNPAMMGGMHPAMSGPQVTQGPMATGMPPNPGTPAPGGPMPNAMAMAHLNGQGQMFHGGGHPQMNMGQMQQQMNANIIARQRAMNMMQAQQGQLGHNMMNMQNMGQLNPQQVAQMKAMNMPMAGMQHMTPQQQQMVQQQQQYQHQQRMMAQHAQAQQQIVAQQQRQAQAQHQQHVQNQQMQLSRSQQEPTTQPPQPVPTPTPQVQPQPQPPPPTTQPQQQTPQPKSQQVQPPTSQPQAQNPPTPQIKQGDPEDDVQIKQDQAKQQILDLDIAKMQSQDFSGQCILQLFSYYDCLAYPDRPDDYAYWQGVIAKYYSPHASVRQQVFNNNNQSDKSFQLYYPSLARFYHSHFESGVKRILMQTFDHTQEALPNGGYHLWSKKLYLTYEYNDGMKVTANGQLNVNFDEMQKIEHVFIGIKGWTDYVPRRLVKEPMSPEMNRQNQSPKMSKKALQKNQQQQRQASVVPPSPIGEWGIPSKLIQFLEIAECMTIMTPLMDYFHNNQVSTPRDALNRFNAENAQKTNMMQNPNAMVVNGQIPFQNQRMGPNQFQSPAFSHLGLPQSQQSPHMHHTPSPGHIQGGVQMVHQMSQGGSNMSGSQAASNNTSPNVSNKRRRASAIKEEDGQGASGEGNKTKPSPRVGKRQKPV